MLETLYVSIIALFQFYLSSIKSDVYRGKTKLEITFQFYLSSIKREEAWYKLSTLDKFQFYLSSIKS